MGVPDGVPEGRCGFVLEPEDLPAFGSEEVTGIDRERFWRGFGMASCIRHVWNGGNRCIWHVDGEKKTVEELVAAKSDKSEQLNGAILEGIPLKGSISFEGDRLVGSRLSEIDLREANLSNSALFGADLAGADLREANLTDADLAGTNLADGSLQEANFTDADLTEAILTDGSLQEANFTGANLVRADLSGAFLWMANFADANLMEADLAGAHLVEADLTDVELLEANFAGSSLREADLTGANLWVANLADANLRKANLAGSNLQEADLTGANLQMANLASVNLLEADLIGVKLRRVDLAEANLREANLARANLQVADLTGANLVEADLTDASLARAKIEDTNFRSTTLYRADFEQLKFAGVDLRDADLREAKLHNAHFQDVRIDDDTTFGDEDQRYRSAYELDADETAETGSSGDDTDDSEDDDTDDGTLPRILPTPLRRWLFWLQADGDSNEEAIDDLEKAIWSYRTYQLLVREQALPDRIPRYYVREKHARRKLALAKDEYFKWFKLALARWTMRYGEGPWQVMKTAVAIVLLFAGLFYLFGGVKVQSVNPTHPKNPPFAFSLPLPQLLETGLANLYFSLVTFTTLGYGDVKPASGAVQFLAGVESLLGAALIALLVAVLSRRVMR